MSPKPLVGNGEKWRELKIICVENHLVGNGDKMERIKIICVKNPLMSL